MTTTESPAPAEVPQKPSGFERVIGVLIEPSETFASIARQPDWLVPLIILLVISAIGGVIFAQRVDFVTPVRESMEERGAPAASIDTAAKWTGAISKVFAYANPVVVTIFLLIISGVLLLAFRALGGEGTFRQAFAATTYASMPTVIKSILVTIIVAMKSGVTGVDIPVILRSNLAFLVTMKEHPMAFAILSSLDIFTIWWLVLLSIGFAYLSKFSKAKSATIVVTLWVIVSLFKLIGPAMQSLRK